MSNESNTEDFFVVGMTCEHRVASVTEEVPAESGYSVVAGDR